MDGVLYVYAASGKSIFGAGDAGLLQQHDEFVPQRGQHVFKGLGQDDENLSLIHI